jgi:hypothetical protein
MQLFQPYHYAAFQSPKPTLDDPATVRERLRAKGIGTQYPERAAIVSGTPMDGEVSIYFHSSFAAKKK